jgi:hypothetical protein
MMPADVAIRKQINASFTWFSFIKSRVFLKAIADAKIPVIHNTKLLAIGKATRWQG